MGGLAAQGGGGPHPIRHIKISDQPIDVKISDQPIDVKISDQPIDIKITTISGQVDTRPLSCDIDHPDICDRASRLVGITTISGQVDTRPLSCDIDHPDICDRASRLVGITTISGQVDTRPLSCDIDHPDICDRASRLVGITYGSRGAQLQQDVSRYLITIDIIHSKIHQGFGFSVCDLTLGVDIVTPKRYLIITPDTSARAHMIFVVETEPGAKFEFFEDTTVTANGTALSIINYKRDSTTTSVLQIFGGPTVTVDGTRIFLWQSGTTTAAGRIGGNIQHADEFILKQNAKYQVKITPLSNSTTVFIHFDWYEIII